jgi:NAD(P)-dependent dehydrogenase (short-subunit alcohol dehydrogenase family)
MELLSGTAVVTGAGSGIGRATALRLAREGCAVACFDRDREAAEETVALTGTDGPAVAIVGDVRQRADFDELLSVAERELPPVRYLVNNAGLATMDGLVDIEEADWDLVIDVNLKGVFLASQVIGPVIAANGGGAIVNLSTVEADVVVASGPNCQPHYMASKGGVKTLTKALAFELGPEVRVNCVAPGPVATQFVPGADFETPEAKEYLRARMVIARAGKPEEIAAAIAFLLSEEASWITGVQLPVDGGWLVT